MRNWKITDNKLIELIESDLNNDKNSGVAFKKNRDKWYKAYYNKPEDDLIEAEESKSQEKTDAKDFNIMLPLTTMAVDKTHSRAMLSILPIGNIKIAPTEKHDIKNVEKIQEWFEWEIHEGIDGIKEWLDEGVMIWLIEGQWITSVKWDRRLNNIKYNYGPFPLNDALTGQPYSPEDFIQYIVKGTEDKRIINIEEKETDKYKITYVEKSGQQNAYDWIEKTCEIEFWQHEYEDGIRATYYGEEIEYDGCIVNSENIDFLNFPTDAKSLKFKDCDHVITIYNLTVEEVIEKSLNGEFEISKDDIEKLKKLAIGQTKEIEADNIVTTLRDLYNLSSQEHFLENILTLFDATYYLDVNKDGKREKVFISGILDNSNGNSVNMLIRKKYFDEVFPYPERPLVLTKFDLIPYSAYGRGIPEKGRFLQQTADDYFCQMLNSGEMQMFPWGFYDDTAGGVFSKRDTIYLKKGQFLKVGNAAGVKFPTFSGNLAAGSMIEQMIYAMWERLLNINDQVMGKSGGARTATATLRLLGESGQNLSGNIRRLAAGLQDVYKIIYKYNLAFMPKEKMYRIMGPDGNFITNTITREELIENPDIKFSIDFESTSKMFKREIYSFLFDKIVPLYTQVGLIKQPELWKIGKKMLEVFDQKDIESWIQKPPNVEEFIDPVQENYMTTQGGLAKAKPEENHVEHLSSHIMDLQSVGGKLPQERIIAKQYHIMEHQQFAQLQQQMIDAAKMASIGEQTSPYLGDQEKEFTINPQQGATRGEITEAYGRANAGLGTKESNQQITGANIGI